MDLKKISQMGGTVPAGIGKAPKTDSLKGGPSFADMLNQVQGGLTKPQAANVGQPEAVKFSNHAVERMMSRGIKFSPEDVNRLGDAISKAAAKGSKDTLVLMNDSALIVSVKNKTVVTVMDKNALKENVFTNIDSTIVM